nr:nucleic acid-binding, OB-fold protein [Tanacetum cinerariifolium]
MIVTEPEITAISDLRPIFCNKRIEAVVYSKWTSKHVHTQQPMKYCCILMDKQSYQNTFALSSSTTSFDFPSFHQKSWKRKSFLFDLFDSVHSKKMIRKKRKITHIEPFDVEPLEPDYAEKKCELLEQAIHQIYDGKVHDLCLLPLQT